MTSLTDYQQQLLFDYCMGLACDEKIVEARALVASSPQASELVSNLQSLLSTLDTVEVEPCPDHLAEQTVRRLAEAAQAEKNSLSQLLAAEQRKTATVPIGFWSMAVRRLATAAVFMVVGGVLITALNIVTNFARQQSWQNQCQMQLGRVGQGIGNYSADHDGRLPSVATTTGAPWWRVGDQGKENNSNTRHVWLLVKDGYAGRGDFVCPGKGIERLRQIDAAESKRCLDFLDRDHMTYSFRIMCDKTDSLASLGDKALMSDVNPLFEKLPYYRGPLNLRVDEKLRTLNSINHNRRGQNVLFGSGAVRFVKRRKIGIAADDIFTLQNTSIYRGVEVPSCDKDTFLAP